MASNEGAGVALGAAVGVGVAVGAAGVVLGVGVDAGSPGVAGGCGVSVAAAGAADAGVSVRATLRPEVAEGAGVTAVGDMRTWLLS